MKVENTTKQEWKVIEETWSYVPQKLFFSPVYNFSIYVCHAATKGEKKYHKMV